MSNVAKLMFALAFTVALGFGVVKSASAQPNSVAPGDIVGDIVAAVPADQLNERVD
jgi:hypothetical protein